MSSQYLSTKSKGLSRFKLLAIPFALTLALGGGAIWYVFNSYNAFKKVQKEDLRLQELSGEIIYFDEVLTSSARLAVATGELKWEERYRKTDKALDATMAEAKTLAPDVFEGAAFTQTSLANEKLVALENQSFQLLRQGQRQQAAALLSSREYQQQKNSYSKGLEATTTALKKTVNKTILTQGQYALSTVVFAGISLAVLLIAWVVVLRILVRYIQTLNETQKIIVTTASGLAASIEQQERTTTNQAAFVNQTTTTMDELGASSRLSAEQAQAAAAGAAQVLVLVQGDRHNDLNDLDDSYSLQAKVGQIAEQFRSLSEQTHQIGTISTLVSQLASQINMLALNAAVEAVRAREHGRGFAIVAAEIRKLADQSKQSGEQINNLVQTIQNATDLTTLTTDEGRKTVDRVVAAVNGIAMNTRQISLTAKQQAIAIQQVLDAMNMVNLGASEAALSIAQTKVETQKLNNAAMNLQAIV